jgi:hypothetical protein
VLGAKIAQRQQLLPAPRRLPFAKAPIAKGFDRDQHNLWDTTKPEPDTGFDLKPPGRAVDTGTSTCVARPIRESDPAGKQPAVARDSTSSFGGMR